MATHPSTLRSYRSQVAILSTLWFYVLGRSVRDIRELTRIRRETIRQWLIDMEAVGWVECRRERHKGHRQRCYYITEAGKAGLRRMQRTLREEGG